MLTDICVVGDRVGAILSKDGDTVEFFGYGVYLGDEIPPHNVGGRLLSGAKNPKIRLDDGTIVWGLECWWGSEAEIKQFLEGATIVHVVPERLEYSQEYQDAYANLLRMHARMEEFLDENKVYLMGPGFMFKHYPESPALVTPELTEEYNALNDDTLRAFIAFMKLVDIENP